MTKECLLFLSLKLTCERLGNRLKYFLKCILDTSVLGTFMLTLPLYVPCMPSHVGSLYGLLYTYGCLRNIVVLISIISNKQLRKYKLIYSSNLQGAMVCTVLLSLIVLCTSQFHLRPAPLPPGQLRGICPPCQSREWGICKFCTARRPGICQPLGHSRAFDTHEVSHQNIITKKVLLEKKQIGSSVKDRNKL